MEIKINLDDKPNLKAAFLSDKAKAKEIVSVFVECMEESFKEDKGIKWSELPNQLNPNLTFRDLIMGILKGALDVRDINPDVFEALLIEVHPLSMLAPRKDFITGEMYQRNWRGHFRLEDDSKADELAISNILRTLLRYSKYVSVKQLAEAIDTKQEMTFRGIGSRVMELLPMRPAIEYQRTHMGELFVGTFDLETGGLDCGEHEETDFCPACKKKDIAQIESNMICFTCNASYRIKEVK
jgi:hypothetical protein